MVDAHSAGDIDATLEFYATDLETLPDASVLPESRPIHGHEEFRSWSEEIKRAWIRPRWETAEVREVGGGRVLHRGEWGGTGSASAVGRLRASRGRLRFELAKSPLPCTTSITTERSKPRGSRSDHARRTAADSDGCDYDGQPYAYSVSRGWPAYGTPFVKWMRIVV